MKMIMNVHHELLNGNQKLAEKMGLKPAPPVTSVSDPILPPPDTTSTSAPKPV